MSKCIIDTEKIGTETKNYAVFYATHDFIVYKDQKKIKMMQCNDELMAEVDCPTDYRTYDCLDLDDGVLFIFAGKSVIFLDKSGFEPKSHEIDIEKVGRIVTKPVKSQNKNSVIFGTSSYGQIQFINYDFFSKKRLSQTQSWKMTEVTDIASNDQLLFSIFDNVFLTSCKIETGECLWTRFENATINGKLLSYKNKLLYNCQNLVRAA